MFSFSLSLSLHSPFWHSRLYPTPNLNLFLRDDGDGDWDEAEAAPEVGAGQPGAARGKPGAAFGSPGSDYFANAYLAALRDSEGIGMAALSPRRRRDEAHGRRAMPTSRRGRADPH